LLTYTKRYAKKLVPPILVDLYRLTEKSLVGPPQSVTRNESPLLKAQPLKNLFPGIQDHAVAVFMQHLYTDKGSLPLRELTILGAISKSISPRRVFEIGTYRGLSTLALAMNTPPDTEIFTLDLAKESRSVTTYPMDMGGIESYSFSVGEYYRGSEYERKIRQLYGDSAIFDFTPFSGSIDLVFIDGNHLYENVRADTLNAVRMLRSNGVIVWDDYHAGYPGVMRCLAELSESKPLVRIAETRFVIYRSSY
jgi:hypothetical protein